MQYISVFHISPYFTYLSAMHNVYILDTLLCWYGFTIGWGCYMVSLWVCSIIAFVFLIAFQVADVKVSVLLFRLEMDCLVLESTLKQCNCTCLTSSIIWWVYMHILLLVLLIIMSVSYLLHLFFAYSGGRCQDVQFCHLDCIVSCWN